MNYAIIRIEKVKNNGKMTQINNHNRRIANCYDNIDDSLSCNNVYYSYDTEHNETELIDCKTMFEQYSNGIKYRKDAIKIIDGILTKSNSLEDEEEWIKQNINFLKNEFEGCPINIQIHKDEPGTVTHIHFQTVPIVEHKLNGSKWFGKKRNLSELQDRYAESMQPLGLSRGVEKSNNHHNELRTYYAEQQKKEKEKYENEMLKQQEQYKQILQQIEKEFCCSADNYENKLQILKDRHDRVLTEFKSLYNDYNDLYNEYEALYKDYDELKSIMERSTTASKDISLDDIIRAGGYDL